MPGTAFRKDGLARVSGLRLFLDFLRHNRDLVRFLGENLPGEFADFVEAHVRVCRLYVLGQLNVVWDGLRQIQDGVEPVRVFALV